jgi:diguanylate cyclase (GGDEF)-like protein
MGIRVQLILIIAAVFLLLFSAAGFTLSHTIFGNVEQMEHEDIVKQTSRFDELLSQQLESLHVSARDWANWDDSFNYLKKPNRHHEKVNLSSTALELIRFNVLALLDLQGRVVVQAEYTGTHYYLGPATAEFRIELDRIELKPAGQCGILQTQHFPMLFCIEPVRTSTNKQPSNGYLLAGRYLGPVRTDELRQAMKQSLDLFNGTPQPSHLLNQQGERGIYRVGWNAIEQRQFEVFQEITGIDGQTAFWVRHVYERSRMEEAHEIFVRMLAWIGGSLLVIVILLYFLLEHILLRRLSRIEQTVGDAHQHHNWAVEVPHQQDRDEIGRLANQIQTLFLEMGKNVRRLQAESLQDALTQLPNRRNFDQKLAFYWQLSQRRHQSLTIMMIDVDYFKNFNDRYGHQAGDMVLRRVGAALRSALYRSTDLVARYGGEEFAAILPDSDVRAAQEVAERLRQAITELNIPHAGSPMQQITISVGAASTHVSNWPLQPTELLRNADMALYEAKANGRNTVQVVELRKPEQASTNTASAD